MKYLTGILLLFIASAIHAQKYALLDEHFAQPISYSEKVTAADKFNGLFPVEKKYLPEFLKALKEINSQLSSKPPFGKVKDYEMGGIKFTGRLTTSSGSERIDYVVTSYYDNIRISMHLCDAKRSIANNAFYVKVWIKYIEENTNR
ncbi:MAG TPA: hypothetical protein VG847_01490 [Chitinophagaceae bacterium]|nr:hypothetical protein [Chitinophagaceae bacterium]